MQKYSQYAKQLYTMLAVISIAWIAYESVSFLQWLLGGRYIYTWQCLVVVLLMPLNWAAEALKLSTYLPSKMSFKSAWFSVVKGQGVGLMTTVGVTSYIGRVHNKLNQAIPILQVSLMSSMIQTVISIGFGLYFIPNLIYHIDGELISTIIKGAWISLIIFILLLILILFFYEKIKNYGLFFLKKYISNNGNDLCDWTTSDSLRILMISLLRYSIYTLQFVLLLNMISDVSISILLSIAVSIYCIQSMIYMPSIFNVIGRGFVLVWLGSHFQMNKAECLGVSWLLFWINIVIPSLIGYILLIKDSKNKWI